MDLVEWGEGRGVDKALRGAVRRMFCGERRVGSR